jgi:hypothetical protein
LYFSVVVVVVVVVCRPGVFLLELVTLLTQKKIGMLHLIMQSQIIISFQIGLECCYVTSKSVMCRNKGIRYIKVLLLILFIVALDATSKIGHGNRDDPNDRNSADHSLQRKKDRTSSHGVKSPTSSDLSGSHKRRAGGSSGGSGTTSRQHHLKLSYHSASTNSTSSTISSQHGYYTYGVDLPSFAFDFSEFVVSATVSFSASKNNTSPGTSSGGSVAGSSGRHSPHVSVSSGSDDLYLYIYLLGHRAIYEDFPFSALYTDIDLIRNWQHAISKWPKERVHTETDRSALFCVCKNNNADIAPGVPSLQQAQRLNRPYIVPAQWLHLAPPSQLSGLNHSNFNRHIDILRCKLKNTQGVYSEASFKKQKRLFVDLVRKDPTSTSTNASLVISFNIPWKKRQVGYPSMHANGDTSAESPSSMAATVSSKQLLQPIKIAACVRSVRPLQQPRAEVTLPMLIEFVEHLLLIGVEHVVLGMALHW